MRGRGEGRNYFWVVYGLVFAAGGLVCIASGFYVLGVLMLVGAFICAVAEWRKRSRENVDRLQG